MKRSKRLVIKLGSSTILNNQTKLSQEWVNSLAKELKALHEEYELVLVCSGAASEGKNHVQLTPEEKSKYTPIARRQLYAAVGQPAIMHAFIKAFAPLGVKIGQALLTRNTFSELNRYYNATAVLNHMLEERVLPIINGNDAITTLELSAGGNDGLAAVVAIALDADRLVLMTDTNGVYDKNPTKEADAKKFDTVTDPDVIMKMISNEVSGMSIGGMYAKIEGARLAWYGGIPTVIANGLDLQTYTHVMDETPPGTLFLPPEVPSQTEQSKIRWFLSARNNFGKVIVDAGAEEALKNRKSLLAVGMKDVIGEFIASDIISIENTQGQIIACGVVAFSADELRKYQQAKLAIDKPVVHADKLKLLYVQ